MSYVCRNCGNSDIATVEDLTGNCPIYIHDEPLLDGQLAYDFSGTTEIAWDSSTTTGFECQDCYKRTATLEELVVAEDEFVDPADLARDLGDIVT